MLAKAGAKVIMTSRDLSAGQQAAKELMQSNPKVPLIALVHVVYFSYRSHGLQCTACNILVSVV